MLYSPQLNRMMEVSHARKQGTEGGKTGASPALSRNCNLVVREPEYPPRSMFRSGLRVKGRGNCNRRVQPLVIRQGASCSCDPATTRLSSSSSPLLSFWGRGAVGGSAPFAFSEGHQRICLSPRSVLPCRHAMAQSPSPTLLRAGLARMGLSARPMGRADFIRAAPIRSRRGAESLPDSPPRPAKARPHSPRPYLHASPGRTPGSHAP